MISMDLLYHFKKNELIKTLFLVILNYFKICQRAFKNDLLPKTHSNYAKVDLNDTIGYVDALTEVINEARFFFYQFNLVCDCFTNDHKSAFRPTDRVKKLAFLKIVIAYDDMHRRFPPYKSRELKHLNLSQRTWGMWKTQIEDGTFPHFVQHKKIGNKSQQI